MSRASPPKRARGNMQLEGKVATITGGTRGIGRGIADAFLAEGANVVVNGRNPEKGAQARQEMGGGDNVTFVAGDVTEQTAVEHLIDATVDRYGRIDILVNNAGGGSDFAPCVDLTDEAWNLGITWNLHAT